MPKIFPIVGGGLQYDMRHWMPRELNKMAGIWHMAFSEHVVKKIFRNISNQKY